MLFLSSSRQGRLRLSVRDVCTCVPSIQVQQMQQGTKNWLNILPSTYWNFNHANNLVPVETWKMMLKDWNITDIKDKLIVILQTILLNPITHVNSKINLWAWAIIWSKPKKKFSRKSLSCGSYASFGIYDYLVYAYSLGFYGSDCKPNGN